MIDFANITFIITESGDEQIPILRQHRSSDGSSLDVNIIQRYSMMHDIDSRRPFTGVIARMLHDDYLAPVERQRGNQFAMRSTDVLYVANNGSMILITERENAEKLEGLYQGVIVDPTIDKDGIVRYNGFRGIQQGGLAGGDLSFLCKNDHGQDLRIDLSPIDRVAYDRRVVNS